MLNFKEFVLIKTLDTPSRLEKFPFSRNKSQSVFTQTSIDNFTQKLKCAIDLHPHTYQQIEIPPGIDAEFKDYLLSDKNMTLKESSLINTPNRSFTADSMSISSSSKSEEQSFSKIKVTLEKENNLNYFKTTSLNEVKTKHSPEEEQYRGVFWCFNSFYKHNPKIKTKEPEFWKEEMQTQFMFIPKKLHLSNILDEPLFCRAALYDLQSKERISEFALFDFDIRGRLIDKNSNYFIFSSDPSPDIALVVQVSRTYQKEVDKKGTISMKNVTEEYALQKYKKIDFYKEIKQEFCFSSRCLFDDYGAFKSENNNNDLNKSEKEIKEKSPLETVILRNSPLFLKKGGMSEKEFIKTFEERLSSSSGSVWQKNLKSLSESYFEYECVLLNDDRFPKKRLSPSLYKLKPPEKELEGFDHTVLELRSRKGCKELLPDLEPFNMLYIHPLSLNSNKYKNMFCRAFFKLNDITSDLKGESVFIFKDKMVGQENLRTVHSNKIPKSDLEWKINLPTNLPVTSHLLIILSKINPVKNEKPYTDVGYTVLKLFNNESLNFISSTNFELKFVEGTPPKNYLKKTVDKSSKSPMTFKGLMGMAEKNTMHLRVELFSSIITNDNYMNMLLSQNSESTKLEILNKMKIKSIVRKFSLLMKLLLSSFGEEKNFGVCGVEIIIKRLREKETEECFRYDSNELLKTWRHFNMQNFKNVSLYLEILKECVIYLDKMEKNIKNGGEEERKNTDQENKLKTFRFLMDCVVKSLKLEFEDTKKIKHRVNFIENYKKMLKLVSNIILKIDAEDKTLKKLVKKIAHINQELYIVLKIETVYELAKYFSECLIAHSDAVTNKMNNLFLSIFFDCDTLTEIILSKPKTTPKQFSSIEKLHPLPALLVKHCVESVKTKWEGEDYVRILAEVLCKHDFDAKMQNKAGLEMIADAFLPFVMRLSELAPEITGNKSEERTALICFIWVLKNCDEDILVEWWNSCDRKVLYNFMVILSTSLRVFRFIGKNRKVNDYKSFLAQIMTDEFETSPRLSSESMGSSVSDFKDKENSVTRELSRSKSSSMLMKHSRSGLAPERKMGGKENLRNYRMRLFREGSKTATQKIKNFTRRSLDNLIKCEGNLCEIVFKCHYRVTARFLEKFPQRPDFIAFFLRFFSENLSFRLTDRLYLSLYSLIHYFFLHCTPLFERVSEKELEIFLRGFFASVLQFAAHPNSEIVSMTSFLIYLVSRRVFEKKSNLEAVKSALTLSLHKNGWVVNLSPVQAKICRLSLEKSKAHSKNDALQMPAQNLAEFKKSFAALIEETMTVFDAFIKMAQLREMGNKCDSTHLEEILLLTANNYKIFPLIRLDWIKKLIKLHEEKNNHVEVAECYFEMCKVIDGEFNEIADSDEEAEGKREEVAKKSFYVENACQHYIKGMFLEKSVKEIARRLVPLLAAEKEWATLSTLHKRAATVYDKLSEMKTNEIYKNFGSYYMVTFYGKAFGKDDGKRFVYRKGEKVQVESFNNELKSKYEYMLGSKVQIIATPPKEDGKNLESPAILTTFVKPVCDNPEGKDMYERLAYKNKFSHQIRFRKSKEGNEVATTFKKVFNILTKWPMPFLLTRQEVLCVKEEVFSPLLVASDDILDRCRWLSDVLNVKPVSISSLEGVITGTLMPQVNGGLKIYFDAFYEKDKGKWAPDKLFVFEEAIKNLLRSIEDAIKVYSRLMKKETSGDKREKMYRTICEYFDCAEKLVREKLGDY